MSRFRRFLAVSFRAKVLVPIIVVMVLLMAVTAGVVNHRITNQFEAEAKQSLATADDAFRALQDFRHKNLLLRLRDLPNQPYYKSNFINTDPNPLKLREPLDRLLAQQGVDIVLFSSADQRLIASSKRDPMVSIAEFDAASARVIRQSLLGEEKSDIIQVGGKLYDVVSVPAPSADGEMNNALTFGSEIGSGVAAELSRFTHSQIVL